MKAFQNIFQFLALGILLVVCPAGGKAELTYSTNADNTITVTGYTGSDAVVTIPAQVGDYPVVSIGDNAFEVDDALTAVILPDSVTSIGIAAFWGCTNLTGITFPAGLNNIGAAAFNSCNISEVTIPAGVTNIGIYAFFYCINLTAITVDAANPAYSSADGVLFNKAKTILLQFPSAKPGSYSIPDGVTNLADEAFGIEDHLGMDPFAYQTCAGLTNLTIPGSLADISQSAFAHCAGLTRVTLASGVNRIGTNAFAWCGSLASVNLPNTVTSIGETAFYYSGLTSVTIPGSVTHCGIGAFAVCAGLTNVTIQAGVTGISVAMFNFSTALSSITLPDSVTSIGERAFWFCSGLTNAMIPDSVTNIGDYAFSGCASLLDIEVAPGNPCYRSLDGALFDKDGTTLIQFPGGRGGSYLVPIGVTTVNDYAFGSYYGSDGYFFPNYPFTCQNLTNITFSSTVTAIGDEGLNQLLNLAAVHFEGDIPPNLKALPYDWYLTYFALPGAANQFELPEPVVWLPTMQDVGHNLVAGANPFGFNINWARGQTVIVDTCTNLLKPDWQPLQTNALTTASTYFGDAGWTNSPARFYRVRPGGAN